MILKCCRRTVALLLLVVVFSTPAFAQYGEYFVAGKVVDKNRHPLNDVGIRLHDPETGTSYTTSTDAKGVFEFGGIPHATYSVLISKEGYATRKDEWKVEQTPDGKRKLEIPTITLLPEPQDAKTLEEKQIEAEIDSIGPKVQAGDCDAALPALQPLFEKRPDDVNILYLQGVCLLKKGSVDAAMEKLRKVVAANPTFVQAHLQLGMCYQRSNMPDQALESYKKVLELDPKELAAAYDAGMILHDQKKPADALPYFEKALALKPDSSDILEAIAYCHLQLKDTAKAIQYLERALAVEKDPARHDALEDQIKKLKAAEVPKP